MSIAYFQKVQFLLTAPILSKLIFYGLLLWGINSKIAVGISPCLKWRTGKGAGMAWQLLSCALSSAPFICIVPYHP